MDSERCVGSQATQLLQHALAPVPQNWEHSGYQWEPTPPKNGEGDSVNDFSLDSRVIPARSVTPCYHLGGQPVVQSPSDSGQRVPAEEPQNEHRQKERERAQGSAVLPSIQNRPPGSALFHSSGDSAASALAKVIGTRVIPSSPSPAVGAHSLSRPTESMPVENKRYHRSPSLPSQDSFAGPVSQDPAERYLASTKQFDVPLSDLGETPTQEASHSPTDPGITLPDASEHREFLEVAMREYEVQRANRLTSIRRPNVLAVASPSHSRESSGKPQYQDDNFSFQGGGPEFGGQEFQFNGSSSFDKMLDRGLADTLDPTPEPTQSKNIDSTRVYAVANVERTTKDDILTTPPRSGNTKSHTPPFEWIAPSPSAAVASSNPRSLLRMVHPDNQYRIARMKNLAGKVDPRPCVSTGTETQPSLLEETQPSSPGTLHILLQSRPTALHQTEMIPTRHQADEEPEDALDIIPDSEPLRVGLGAQSPGHDLFVTQSPIKKPFRPLSPVSEQGSTDLVLDSLEAEESEADVPLAIEVTARTTKKHIPPAESVVVHSRKKRTTLPAVPAKLPTHFLERRPQGPTSSTTRLNSKAKASKTVLAEVPTSLPEQDLQSQTFSSGHSHVATTNNVPSKNEAGGSENPSNLTTCLVPTKPVGINKRSRKSDTESSEGPSRRPTEDKRRNQCRPQKEEEEEEESNSTNGLGGDSPPPPPKSDMSRQKRRRIEGVHPLGGSAKASTLTRSKPSNSPVVSTRSAKRLRSGPSSVLGSTAEPATRVFALWKQDGHYYSGVIYSRGPKNKHLIKFDDGTEDEVELKNMRHQELLVGDRVIVIQDHIKGMVTDVSHADSLGTFTLEADNGIQTLRFPDIRIANRTIQSQWTKRTILAENIVTVVGPKPPTDTTPSKKSVTGTTSSKVGRELAKTGFVVTINPKNENPIQTKDEAMCAIKQHGGLVVEDWSSVFTMEGKHSQSNKRWIATQQDFRRRSEVKLDRVFLLSDDAHQKPKFLLALALGIPCLSFEWLTRGDEVSSDWQPFLLPAGYSDPLGARISQLVDLDWGNCTEHLADIMESTVPIKLFSQKSVLCVGAELVPLPPSRARKNATEEASRYVPWIILCMGAPKVEAVTDARQVALAYMNTFDYIIVKERNVLGSLILEDDVVVGDVNWVKECLISSRLSVPQID